MIIGIDTPVVYKHDGVEVHGKIAAMDGGRLVVLAPIGVTWTFSVGDITNGRLKIDERHLPENQKQVDAPVSDVKNDGPYFWRNSVDGKLVQYGSEPTNVTPHWCDWHEWATAEKCPLCEKGDYF
jgi:hypothetical protein